MPRIARILAWTLVAALAFVTLAPIGLRPVVAASPGLERAAAYALLGFAMALAYPRHRLLAFAIGIGVAAGLEYGQLLTESRHARLRDFVVKALAAGLGVLVAHAALALATRRGRHGAVAGK